MFSKLNAKDIIVYLGALALGYFLTDFVGSMRARAVQNSKEQTEQKFNQKTSQSAQELKLMVTLKDIEIKLTRTEGVVNQIKSNNDRDMKQIKEELTSTRESFKSEITRTNTKIYDIRKDVSNISNQVSVLKNKVEAIELELRK